MFRSEPVIHGRHQRRGPRRDTGIEPIGLCGRPEGEPSAVKVHHQRQCVLMPKGSIDPHRQGAVAQRQPPLLDGDMAMRKSGDDAGQLRGAQFVQPIARGDQLVVGQLREWFGQSARQAKQANSQGWVRCHRRIVAWLGHGTECAGAGAEQKGRDTVSDVYLFAPHRSQQPRRSLSSHEPATDVNASSLPGNPERCDIVGDSANHVGICGVDGRCRTHRCDRPRANGECHALRGARSEYRPPGQFDTHARAPAGGPAPDRAPAP